MRTGILIGLGAGLVSALVLVAAATGTSPLVLFFLFFLAPMPIIIVGLGWGWAASGVAAAAAAVAMLGLSQPRAAILHFVAIGLPMAMLAYFIMLNRLVGPAQGGTQPAVEWYPIGRVLAITVLIAGAIAALALFSVASDVAGLEKSIRQAVDRFANSQLSLPGGEAKTPEPEQLDAFAKLMTQSFAAAVASIWMFLAIFNLWLGGLVAKASGRLMRPWPDLSMITLPREAPLAFIGAIGLSFLPGYAGLIASGFAGALFLAYMLVGLAIIHNLTLGLGVRPLVLFATYFALFVFNPFSSIIIAMIAISEPILPFRRGAGPAPDPNE